MARGGLWLPFDLGSSAVLGAPEPIEQPGTTEGAQPIRRIRRRAVGVAVEAEVGRPILRRKSRGIAQPGDASAAGQVRPRKRQLIGPGRDRQRALAVGRRRVLEPVLEHDGAQQVRPVKRVRVGQAVELAAASTITRRKPRRVRSARERQRAHRIT